MGFGPSLRASQSVPARIFDVIYQNTEGYPRLITVSAICRVIAADGDCDGYSGFGVVIDPDTPPGIHISQTEIRGELHGLQVIENYIKSYLAITALVPPNYYYKVMAYRFGDGELPVLEGWSEWDIKI